MPILYKRLLLGLLVGAVLLSLFLGFRYMVNLESELVKSENNVNVLKDSINRQSLVLEQKQAELNQILKINKELTQSVNIKTKKINDLIDSFNINASGDVRDIGKLALEKPKLIENIVNRGTQSVIDCLDNVTKGGICEK